MGGISGAVIGHIPGLAIGSSIGVASDKCIRKLNSIKENSDADSIHSNEIESADG